MPKMKKTSRIPNQSPNPDAPSRNAPVETCRPKLAGFYFITNQF